MNPVRVAIWLAALALCLAAQPSRPLVSIPGTTHQVKDGVTGVDFTVALDDFLISPTELTQREFEALMGYNPSFNRGPELPVENASWWEAIRYCNLRSIKEGLQPCYDLATGVCDVRRNGYRLPSDAEWEHAAADPPSSANLGSSDTKSVARLASSLKTSGTKPVGSYQANRYGLYDMTGNVWEWCNDYAEKVASPTPAMRGLARMIRGGSFMSTTSNWARGYRSSMEPGYKSRFTGFRVCRTAERKPATPAEDANWYAPYNQPPPGYESATGDPSSLVAGVGSLSEWRSRRAAIEAKWRKMLGTPEVPAPPPAARTVETIADQHYDAELMYLQVEPEWWEKILVMRPPGNRSRPRPVVIVPYYDVDTPAGRNLSGREFSPPGVRSFAYMAVQKGYIAVAIRWFGESYGEGYAEAVANLKLRHPNSTGLGKWVWDAHRLVDYLYTLPDVDRTNIGIIGHSLGAKMALYAAAFDARIGTVVFSEGGIGLPFSNYDDFWYFGDAVNGRDKATDQHELLGLIAPRPFLLVGGDEYDSAKSWFYINAARPVYRLYGSPLNIGYFNHHKGHTPTAEAVSRSMDWLARFLGPAE